MSRRFADEILAALRRLSGPNAPEPEEAHHRADKLLCEAILSLAAYCDEHHRGPEPVILRARRVVRAWRRVAKWYS